MSILLCYLAAPGADYAEAAHQWDESYRYYEPGIKHDLLYVVKDGAQPEFYEPLGPRKCRVARHPNCGFDIWSLQQVCHTYPDYDWVCWMGSRTRIQAHGWLQKLYSAAMLPQVAIVGATGSYESGVSYQRPNPHLRTGCLLLAPTVLNSLGFGPADTRTDCYEFEHGIHSLTARVRRIGLRVLVVGVRGYYDIDDWPTSQTFRAGEQENLLVADHHSDDYMEAGPEGRMALERLAWTR